MVNKHEKYAKNEAKHAERERLLSTPENEEIFRTEAAPENDSSAENNSEPTQAADASESFTVTEPPENAPAEEQSSVTEATSATDTTEDGTEAEC